MEYHDASDSSDAARLSLMAQSADVLGIQFSRFIQFAEDPSSATRLSGFPAPPQSGPAPSWTPGELATLEHTALAMGMPFSRLMRFAEDTARRPSQVPNGCSSGGHTILNSERYSFPDEDLAMNEDPWVSVRVPSFDSGTVESNPSFSRQPMYSLQNHTTHFGEGRVWPHVSHLEDGQIDPWNTADISQSHHQSSHPSSNAWTPSPNSGTSHLPQFTPYHSSQGSPAGLSGHRSGSYPPPFGALSPQDFEEITLGIGTGQTPEVPVMQNVAVQTDVSDFRISHVASAYNAVPTVHRTVALPSRPRKESQIPVVAGGRVEKPKRITSKDTKGNVDTTFTCLQCSRQRKKCLPGGPGSGCETCAAINNPQCSIPCVHERLEYIILNRKTTDLSGWKPYRELARDDAILKPALSNIDSQTRLRIRIRLSQGPADLILIAKPFNREKALESAREGHDRLYTHAYALGSDAKVAVREFIRKNFAVYMNHYLHEQNCWLDLVIFKAAACEVKKPREHVPDNYRSLVSDALLFWSASRTMEGGWMFSQDQTSYPDGSGGSSVPLTSAPFIDYQMSAILVGILEPMKRSLLRRLENLARKRNPELWYTLFLVTYILLHSYGQLAKQQARFARSRGLKVRFPLMSLMTDLQNGSQLLLSYFHVTNKGKPFTTIKWKESQTSKTIAKLSDEQILLMEYLSSSLKERNMESWFSTIPQQSLDHDYYFTGQMFIPVWKPRSPIITAIAVGDDSECR